MFALLVAASADVPPNRFECDEDTVSVIAPATITRAFSVETEVHWSAKRQFGLRGADAAALTAQLYQRYLGEDVLEGLMGRYTAEFWMPRAAALAVGFDASRNASALARPPRMSTGATPPASVRAARHVRRVRARKTQRQIDRWLDRTVSAAHCPAVLAPLAQGGELAPSKKLMAAAKLSRGSSLLRWRRRGNLRQEPEVDDGVVWHIRVAPGAWRAVITELVAQGKDVACDFFFERK